jgi:hypothetical protein
VSDGGDDELVGGADREPARVPRWATALGALPAVAVVGLVVTRGGGEPSTVAPSPSSSATSPSPSTRTGYPPLEGPLAITGQTCLTTQRGRFTITFGLQNTGLGRVTVLSVAAHLPLGGLRPTGGRVPATRSCGGAEIDPGTSTVLEPGDRVPASLGFELPADCPAPWPVQVDVAVVGPGETPGTQRIPVLADLGGYHVPFGTCVST